MMKIVEPEPDGEARNKYDGSSLPLGSPKLISLIWGGEQLAILKEAGYFHDDLVVRYPNRLMYCRLLFYLKILSLGGRPSLVLAVSPFLAIYDWSPKRLKKLFKSTVKEK